MLYQRFAWVGLLVALMSGMLVSPAGAASSWREVRGDGFLLRARGDVKNLLAVGCDLQRVSDVVRQVSGDMPTAVSVAVIAVDNERDLRELLPQFWERRGVRPLGAYWTGPYGHHIVIRVDVPPAERVRRILHEYAHFTTHVAYGDALPWLDEGLSEIWTNAEIDGNQVELGRSISTHLKLLKTTADWIPVQELASAKALPPPSDRKKLARFYAESWALVHYLAFERAGGRLAFEPHPGSETLPPDAELQRYIKEWRPRSRKIQVPGAATAEQTCSGLDVHEVDPLDGLLGQAQALADGQRPAAALPVLQQASSLAPLSPQVAEVTGVVRFLGSESAEAAAIFDQLIAEGTASHLSYYYRAVLTEVVPSRTNGAGQVPASEYLRTALRLNPSFAPARERLANFSDNP